MMKDTAAQATNMEMAFLQSQIKPHFLFNVLNTIIALSHLDIEKAREVTADFTNYLRMSFDFQNTSGMSSFKHELSIVNSYLSIEKRASAIGWTSFTILRKTSTLPFRL